MQTACSSMSKIPEKELIAADSGLVAFPTYKKDQTGNTQRAGWAMQVKIKAAGSQQAGFEKDVILYQGTNYDFQYLDLPVGSYAVVGTRIVPVSSTAIINEKREWATANVPFDIEHGAISVFSYVAAHITKKQSYTRYTSNIGMYPYVSEGAEVKDDNAELIKTISEGLRAKMARSKNAEQWKINWPQ